MGGRRSSPTTTTTIQKADPWVGVQPYLKEAYGDFSNLYKDRSQWPDYFPGNTIAPMAPQTQAAIDYTNQVVNNQRQLANQVGQAFNFGLGDILNPSSNQYLQAAANEAIRPVMQQLTQQVLPSIDSQAVEAGAFGGSRHGIAQSNVIDAAIKDALGTTSQMYSDAYGKGLDVMSRFVLGSPAIMQSQALPLDALYRAGDISRMYEQMKIDDQINRFNYEQQLPWTMSERYLSALMAAPWGSSGSMTAPGPSSGGLAGALGGAMAGYGMASMMGGAGGASAAALGGVPMMWPLILGGAALGAFG